MRSEGDRMKRFFPLSSPHGKGVWCVCACGPCLEQIWNYLVPETFSWTKVRGTHFLKTREKLFQVQSLT